MPINSVYLEKPAKEKIYETYANADYSCSASLPADWSYTYSKGNYSGLKYEWTFSPDGSTSSASSGSHQFSGLAKGAENEISATVKVTCTEKTYSREDDYDYLPTGAVDDEGNAIMGWQWVGYTAWELDSVNTEYSVGDASVGPHTIYTHPGQSTVYSGLAFDQTIQYNLTSGMVAKWCEHCGKWRSWWFQSNEYSSANDCQVNSNDVITAGWFNGCTAKAVASSPSVSGGPTGTIISADLFKQQDALISRRE